MASGYDKRSVDDWLQMATEGQLALPSFQRNYVWNKRQSVADYLLAVFRNWPTGLFLVLKTNGTPQFRSRTLSGIEDTSVSPGELLLDGQQRLTSLWQVFNGVADADYFVKVDSLLKSKPVVLKVEFGTSRNDLIRSIQNPRMAYENNFVPLSILLNKVDPADEFGQIWAWCREVFEEATELERLRRTITSLRENLLLRPELHYFELPADTERDKAIHIFVQSNQSSVKVNEFDIAVAIALEKGGDDLRERIGSFGDSTSVFEHYIPSSKKSRDKLVPAVGEWIFLLACIRELDEIPKRRRFGDAVRKIFGPDSTAPDRFVDKLLEDVHSAFSMVSEYGASTRETLPALPPVHVLAALQGDLRRVKKSLHHSMTNQVLRAYLWRSFFTRRYDAQGNDGLFHDYKALSLWISQIIEDGRFDPSKRPPIFEDAAYPLPTAAFFSDLRKPFASLRRSSRYRRAFGALMLSEQPLDWVTGARLDAYRFRSLVLEKKLDRHHLFPRAILRGNVEIDALHHALNGVFLTKATNQTISKKEPAEFIEWILKQPGAPDEAELRKRVEGHLVPYDALIATGPLKGRYSNFIEHRADLVENRVRHVAVLPNGGISAP